MKPLSSATNKKINAGLRSVKGKYVLLGLAVAAGAGDAGLRYYEAVGSAGDFRAAAQEQALLEKDIRMVGEQGDRLRAIDSWRDRPAYEAQQKELGAAAEKVAPDFVFSRNLSTRELADLSSRLNMGAGAWWSGARLPGWEEDKVAAIHLCQNDILSRPGAVQNNATAQAIVACSVNAYDNGYNGLLWAVGLTFVGLAAKGMLQGHFRGAIEGEEHQLGRVSIAAGPPASVNVSADGGIQASIPLTLGRDVKVSGPLKLKPKVRMFV